MIGICCEKINLELFTVAEKSPPPDFFLTVRRHYGFREKKKISTKIVLFCAYFPIFVIKCLKK